jgi:excisionase family DNA binding protein
MTDDPLLTTEEVIEYLQLNLKTVYRLVSAGKLPAVRVGRQWRFRKSDLDATLAAAGKSAPPPASGTVTCRVLVVDDEEPVRQMVATMLRAAGPGFEVVGAGDGAAALEELTKRPAQLLITDLRMPGMEGIALIREARRLLPDLPVVIITGRSKEADAIEAIELGVAGYLTKPFDLQQMLRVVNRALGLR